MVFGSWDMIASVLDSKDDVCNYERYIQSHSVASRVNGLLETD